MVNNKLIKLYAEVVNKKLIYFIQVFKTPNYTRSEFST